MYVGTGIVGHKGCRRAISCPSEGPRFQGDVQLPGDLAAAGNYFFCPGRHKPLGATIERQHLLITVTGLLQTCNSSIAVWTPQFQEGLPNGHTANAGSNPITCLFNQHQPFLAYSSAMLNNENCCNTPWFSKVSLMPAFTTRKS